MKTKILFFVLIITAFTNVCAQENSSGIFLTTNFKKKNCPNILLTRNKKINVCATLRPIITPNEFASITEISDDKGKKISYFHLVLTQKGTEKLKNVISQLAGTELVLVVDNTVVGFIKNKNQIVNQTILIDGPANTDEVPWVYEHLLKIINTEN